MKKLISIFVMIGLLASMPTNILIHAEDVDKSYNSNIVEICDTTKSLPESEKLSIDLKSTEILRESPEKFVTYDAVLLDYNIIDKIEVESTEQIIQNGTKLVIYGDNIKLHNIFETFGEGYSALAEDTNKEIAAVLISITHTGMPSYSYICNSYPKEAKRISRETGEEVSLPINNEKVKIKKSLLIEQINAIHQYDIKSTVKYETINYQTPVDENAYLQISPNEYKMYFDTFYNHYINGKLCAVSYSPVYIYDKGRPKSDTSLHEWDFFSYNTINAYNNYMINYLDVYLDAKGGTASTQKYKYHTQLPSDSSLNVGANLGATLDSNGIQLSVGLSKGYTIPTNGLTIDNLHRPQDLFCRWKATTDAMTKVNYFPGNLPRNNSIQLEAFLTLRNEHKAGYVEGKRWYGVSVIDCNVVSYNLYFFNDDYEIFSPTYRINNS